MNDDRYALAKSIFLAVCDLPVGDRHAALQERCGDDEELLRDVQSYLAHYSNGADTSATIVSEARQDDGDSFPEVSNYKVIRELGRGGMGVVYLAQSKDEMLRRTVAVKVVKRGMDTEEVLRRFELERQLLAAMNHPGIARLYDAGRTDDGRPYFVMEYIEGTNLLEYANTHRLSITERLKLFRRVCDAVHYAHQNLIVHRDLKPSNILVGEDGSPKLLDFGIAKMLNPTMSPLAGAPTGPELRLMTPQYASPEQVRGNPIGTASDIYALGVLLYEIVSGHSPYRLHSIVREELVRVICTVEPQKPSTKIASDDELALEEMDTAGTGGTGTKVTPEDVARVRESRPERLRKRLSGDVDNIVLMAMRKEPQRRYASAEQLSDDIGRHLDGMPVRARRDTALYRTQKFVGRHRGGVGMAAVLAISLVGGITASSLGWSKASQEEARAKEATREAERRFDNVRDFANLVMYDVHDAIETLPGATEPRRKIIDATQRYLEGIGEAANTRPDLRSSLADGYIRLGDISGGIRGPNAGDPRAAFPYYEKALVIREAVLADLAPEAPERSDQLHAVAEAQMRLGDAHRLLGDIPAAVEQFEAALETERRRVAIDDGPEAQRGLAIALQNMGTAYVERGDDASAIDVYRQSVEVRRALVRADPSDQRAQRDLSSGLLRLGGRYAEMGELQNALQTYEDAESIRLKLAQADPENTRWKRDLAVARYFVARTLLELGRPEDAMNPIADYTRVTAERVEANPGSDRARRDLAAGAALEGEILLAAGRPEDAIRVMQDGIAVADRLVTDVPTNVTYRALLGLARLGLAEAYAAAGDLAAARREGRQAMDTYSLFVSVDSTSDQQITLAAIRRDLAAWALEAGDADGALVLVRQSVEDFDRLALVVPSALASDGLAHARATLALVELARAEQTTDEQTRADRRRTAETALRQAEGVDEPTIATLRTIAAAQAAFGRSDDARATLLRALDAARAGVVRGAIQAEIDALDED